VIVFINLGFLILHIFPNKFYILFFNICLVSCHEYMPILVQVTRYFTVEILNLLREKLIGNSYISLYCCPTNFQTVSTIA
jgi:hypothetical protein